MLITHNCTKYSRHLMMGGRWSVSCDECFQLTILVVHVKVSLDKQYYKNRQNAVLRSGGQCIIKVSLSTFYS